MGLFFNQRKLINNHLKKLGFDYYAEFIDNTLKKVYLNIDGRILVVFKKKFELLDIQNYNVSVKLPKTTETTFAYFGKYGVFPVETTYDYYFVFAKKENNSWERQFLFTDTRQVKIFMEWMEYYESEGLLENFIPYY